MTEPVEKESAESMLAEIEKKITEAFDIFDHESNKTVDVREIGTIVRSLGCCPSEGVNADSNSVQNSIEAEIPTIFSLLGELHDMLAEIEEEEPTGYIRFEKFLPMMTHVLMERRYKPSPEDQLLRAFEVLDQDKKGSLSQEEISKYVTEEGEPFTQEELDEFLSAAVDPDRGVVLYKDYVSLMAVEDT